MRLFNNLEKIGVEHIGGIARAVDLTDVKTLQEVVPILGGEKVNKAKGLKYDRPMTGLVQNIIRSDIPEAQEKSLKALNLMGKRAGKEFGVPVSSYELTDEGLKEYLREELYKTLYLKMQNLLLKNKLCLKVEVKESFLKTILCIHKMQLKL